MKEFGNKYKVKDDVVEFNETGETIAKAKLLDAAKVWKKADDKSKKARDYATALMNNAIAVDEKAEADASAAKIRAEAVATKVMANAAAAEIMIDSAADARINAANSWKA